MEALLAAAGASPEGPAALVALRRLSELAEESPERAAQVDAGLVRLLEGGRLRGLAAYRARVARALAAEALGDHAGAARYRGENGAVTAWTLAGPYSELRVLDFDRPIPPEAGVLPARGPGAGRAAGLPDPRPPRARRHAGAGGRAARRRRLRPGGRRHPGARWPLPAGRQHRRRRPRSCSTARLVHERRSFAAWLPTSAYLPVELGRRAASPAGEAVPDRRHRRPGRLAGRAPTATASDAGWSAPAPGAPPPPATARPQPPAPAGAARELVRGAGEASVGPVLARLLAARDALSADRVAAKALLSEALALAPGSASVLVAVADARDDDPTLDRQAGQARAEAALREALRTDPGHAEARVRLARLLRATERYDAADEVLAGPPRPGRRAPPGAVRPGPLRRGSRPLRAGRGPGRRGGGRRRELRRLRAGRLGLALRRRRWRESTRPWRWPPAAAAGASGWPASGCAAATRPARWRRWSLTWPRAPGTSTPACRGPRRWSPPGRRGPPPTGPPAWPTSGRAARGSRSRWPARSSSPATAAGARAARERALLLDGGDLDLRRALALQDGREVLDDLGWDARTAIRDYEAAGRRNGTSSVMVLDAAAVDIHPGAVATERTQQVIHVLDQAGVEKHGEVTIPAGAQLITARTLKPDGRALEPDRTSDGKGSLSLSGLEPGDYVQLDYVRAVRAPFGTLGYASDAFFFQAAQERLFRSTYAVRAPAGAGLEVDAHGMPAPGVVSEGGSEVVRAELRDVPPAVPEPGAPSMGEFMPWLVVGTGAARDAFQRGFADRMEGRTLPTEELAAFAALVRAEAPGASPMALARATYARVARTILGDGPFFEDASQVLSRGRGSRLLVLKAVLTLLGLEARVAVVRPYGADPSFHRFPNPGLYSALLLRVRAGAEVAWLDPSTRQNPFGAVPGWLAGCEALVLPQAGEPPLLDRTPERAVEEDGREVGIRVALAADGTGELTGTDRYRGVLGAMLKAQLEPLDQSQRRQALEGMLSKSFQGIALAELTFEGEDDPAAPLLIRWKGRARIARPDGAGLLIDASPLPARLGSRYVRLASRATPLLLASPERSTLRLELVPPPGLQAVAEPPARLESGFGSYLRTDTPAGPGGGLLREERLELARGRIRPERYRDFAAFAASVDGLQEGPIRFTP